MWSKAVKQALVRGGVLILVALLLLVNQFVEFSPWAWAAALAVAGLLALVPSKILRGQAIACYVLPAIALPFLVAFVRDRARWWALIPAYPLLAIVGVIGLAESGLFSDDLVSIYVLLAVSIPFLVIHARGGKRWWRRSAASIRGGILALIGVSFLVVKDGAVDYFAFALLVVGAWVLVSALVGRRRSGEASISMEE